MLFLDNRHCAMPALTRQIKKEKKRKRGILVSVAGVELI